MKIFIRLFLIICFLISYSAFAQLGFCPGNTGEAIFEEDFGQGTTNGPALDPSITTYTYVNQGPEDGQYTISSNLGQLAGFHNMPDNTGNNNGRALIVNASFDAGLFFQIPIDGLCENNPYEFSAFLVNLYNVSTNFCPGTGIPVNVRFQIWDETDTTLLAEGDTGDIQGSNTPPNWEQYALNFETLPGQTSVILKMLNNGDGGCGNDLAIDDIVFKSCGDLTQIFDEDDDSGLSICENNAPDNITLSAEPDFSVYEQHFYQWQGSTDNTNWENIPGETSEAIVIDDIDTFSFFRVLVAEDLINVNNNLCNSISNVFELEVIESIPALSLGDVEICEGEEGVLEVETNPAIRVDWYDAPVDGDLLLEDSFTFEPETEGTYYAESTTIEGDCTADERTPIEFSIQENTIDETESIQICEGDTVTLDAEVTDVEVTYLWSTDEITPQITVEDAGTYTVERETLNGCISIKTFEISFFEEAVVQNIESDNGDIVIQLENSGDFQFSLDGVNFQSSPVFENVAGGLYNISINSNDCETQLVSFPHLVIPQFFTPNGDGINDFFRIPADQFFEEFSISIFDRYGKLIISAQQAPFVWDGTYQGRVLPSQDYWYRLSVNGQLFTGNITLKR